jgi:hypothetical protein
MLVDHLVNAVLQEHDELVERVDLPLQLKYSERDLAMSAL